MKLLLLQGLRVHSPTLLPTGTLNSLQLFDEQRSTCTSCTGSVVQRTETNLGIIALGAVQSALMPDSAGAYIISKSYFCHS